MICNHKETSRVGLYVMVFLILMQTCEINNRTGRMERNLNKHVLEKIEEPVNETANSNE